MIVRSGAGLGATAWMAACAKQSIAGSPSTNEKEPFRYCLNTATIRGKKLPLDQEIKVAAQAGYSGIEPWVDNIGRYGEQGGSLKDIKKQIADLGLTVESAIGFPTWCVDDDERRAKGMQAMQRDMDLVRQIGGRRIAAPPAGAHGTSGMDLRTIGERYRAVLELGRKMGVVAQLEIWGSSKTLGRVADAAHVAIEAGHPDACLLLDAYHIYKSGSSFEGLKLLNGASMHAFHVNDYPADPPREKIGDGDRVYPGDGVAPLASIFQTLYKTGFRGALSLELFNRKYWDQHDAQTIASTGFKKMRAVVQKAFA